MAPLLRNQLGTRLSNQKEGRKIAWGNWFDKLINWINTHNMGDVPRHVHPGAKMAILMDEHPALLVVLLEKLLAEIPEHLRPQSPLLYASDILMEILEYLTALKEAKARPGPLSPPPVTVAPPSSTHKVPAPPAPPQPAVIMTHSPKSITIVPPPATVQQFTALTPRPSAAPVPAPMPVAPVPVGPVPVTPQPRKRALPGLTRVGPGATMKTMEQERRSILKSQPESHKLKGKPLRPYFFQVKRVAVSI